MGFTAVNLETNQAYFSRGANKIAEIVGCCPSTITKFFKTRGDKVKEKVIKGFSIRFAEEIKGKPRGNPYTGF